MIQLLFRYFELKSYDMHGNTLKAILLMLIFSLSSQCFAAFSENELVDQLRSDYRVLQQARGDLQRASRSNTGSSAEVVDLQNWVRQLDNQIAADCRELSSLPSAKIPGDLPCEKMIFSHPAPAELDLNAETTQRQKTRSLENKLNSSLGEFDERLLREQDRIKTRTPRTESAAAAGSGASGGESAGSSGSAADESGTGSDGSQEGKRDSGAEGQATSPGNNEKGTAGRPSTKAKSSAPAGFPDGKDDDVIARQIREAAEKETDPELKKKLWDEYRRYKGAIIQ
jgi:hypothetical protein